MVLPLRYTYSTLPQANSSNDNIAEKTWSVDRATGLRRAMLSGSLILLAAILGFVLGTLAGVFGFGAFRDITREELSWCKKRRSLNRLLRSLQPSSYRTPRIPEEAYAL